QIRQALKKYSTNKKIRYNETQYKEYNRRFMYISYLDLATHESSNAKARAITFKYDVLFPSINIVTYAGYSHLKCIRARGNTSKYIHDLQVPVFVKLLVGM